MVQTQLQGFRAIASRTGEHIGTSEPEYDTEEGEHPGRAWVSVFRRVRGERCEFRVSARWSEFKASGPFWSRMPWHMLGKVAESQALRKAFPEQLGGLYTAEELAQGESR